MEYVERFSSSLALSHWISFQRDKILAIKGKTLLRFCARLVYSLWIDMAYFWRVSHNE
ncbi:hypothetical protein HanRHA438_Chr04g0156141 [Helianthus annuus]|nr:hypothetical protein HanRHA438_Chr04g0156141 [Helianthus annuus]